ncbi:MAG TPA: DNA-binding protein Alba [Methanocorpusculum sp.]|nr:DNA-binding protein Alba [Methanocorpusculum sp.]
MSDNIILVGTKPVMNYVLAVITQFNTGVSEVVIKARGKTIVRAVDAAEIVINQFMSDVSKKNVSISTDTIETDDGPSNVSCIEIILERKQ